MYQFVPRAEMKSVLDIADFMESGRAEIAYRHFVYGRQEAIYIEGDGILLGIVSIGDLERHYGNREARLEINRRFSCADKIDGGQAAAFFRRSATFYEFPVVNGSGRLEGVMKRETRHDIRQDQLASLVVSKYLGEMWHRKELSRFLAHTRSRVVLYYTDEAAVLRGLSGEAASGAGLKGGEAYWKGLTESQWDAFLGEPGAVGSLRAEFGNFHTEMVKGVSEIAPMAGEFYHCEGGSRVTAGNPENPESRVVLYGPCTVAGAYCRDGQTIASCLQRMLNARTGQRIQVINRGLFNMSNFFSRMMTDALGEKDTAVIYVDKRWLTEETARKCVYVGNLAEAFLRVGNLENKILDSPEHCNYEVNECLAGQIFCGLEEHRLLDAVDLPAGRARIQDYYIGSEIMSEVLLYMERNGLLQGDGTGRNGAMALLADPFTGRHRRAAEHALRKVDRLYLFLAEDSNLHFSLEERLRIAKEALADLGRDVVIAPAGKYLYAKKISRGIRKQKPCDVDMEFDCDIFGELFGKFMGIRHRFVLGELDNPVERKYMDACFRVLPRFGMGVEEL